MPSPQPKWILLALILTLSTQIARCEESLSDPLNNLKIGENEVIATKPDEDFTFDESALWNLVHEHQEELRPGRFGDFGTDPSTVTTEDKPTIGPPTVPQTTTIPITKSYPSEEIMPNDTKPTTETTEDNPRIELDEDESIETEEIPGSDPKPAPLIAVGNLLDPGYNRESCLIMPDIRACQSIRASEGYLWYYDQIEKQCLATSDCILNENRFESEEACQSTCQPKMPFKRCLAPPKVGYAQCAYSGTPSGPALTIQKAYFDKVLEKCSWFVYLGCGGSDNQFPSIEECNNTCMSPEALATIRKSAREICELPHMLSDGPNCDDLGQMSSRWYYDQSTGLCKEFGYTHCGGTANNFLSKSSCELYCGARKLTQEEICELPPEVGECVQQTAHKMWYYDSATGECSSFAYSGCGGNENRFPTRTSCLDTCRPQPATPLVKYGFTEDEEHEEAIILSQLEKPSMEEVIALSKENDSDDEGPLETDPPKETLATFPPLIYNLSEFTPQPIDIEPCRKRPEAGKCTPIECFNETGKCETKRLIRWFFNPRTSNCENFAYSGCGGTANTFDSAQSCSVACKQRIMRPERDKRCDNDPKRDSCYSLPLPHHKEASTEGPEVLFFFSIASGTCRAFHLKTNDKGCTRDSYFVDGQECLKACTKSSPTEEDLPNRCFARKRSTVATNCPLEHHNVSRWSFLSDLQQCVLFSECHDPNSHISSSWGNNFETKELCEATCIPRGLKDICRLPKDTGPCKGGHARYYYDPNTAKCRLFMYGGCLGNGNRFTTKVECEEACGAMSEVYDTGAPPAQVNDASAVQVQKSPQVPVEVFEEMRRITVMYSERYPWDLCLQHHTYGTCPRPRRIHDGSSKHGVHLTRFFYNRKTKHCEPYFYTGCGARGNHFETKSQCDNVCARRLRRSVSQICDASHVEECHGSGLQLWIYEADAGTCRQIEVCPPNITDAFQPQLGGISDVFSLWPSLGGGGGVNGHLLPGTFASSSACYNHCLPPTPSGTDVTNICHMNPITSMSNDCRMMGERWYFDVKEGYCRSYYSCPVYGNNFPDEETCNSACRPKHITEVCRLPLDYGGCSKFLPRWYYNTERRRCEQFSYGGCFGNSNRFLTKYECDNACTFNDVCGLAKPKEAEGNEPSTLRYYFNQSNGMCEKFYFSGKIPQGNNFPNEDTCRSVCTSSPNLLPISVKVNRMAVSMTRLATKFGHVARQPVLPRGHKPACISSSQLLGILKNETIENCHPGGTVTELAFAYDGATNSCFATMIYVCLDYPNEPYRIKILGRPLIFESETHCESECLLSES
nr:Papilin [Hymenolepis microstoma]